MPDPNELSARSEPPGTFKRLLILAAVIGLDLAIVTGADSAAAPGAGWVDVLAAVLFLGTIFGGIIWLTVRAAMFKSRLKAQGKRGTCEVVAAQQQSTGRAESIKIALRLRVTLPGEAAYSVRLTQSIEQLHLARVAVGKKLPVVVDPNEKSHMMLLLE